MRELGWIDGQNITIERMTAKGQPDRYARLAQELLNLKLNLMVVAGSGLTQAIMQATTTIPIVSAGAFGDAVVEAGVKSVARPGGNLTGLTVFSIGTIFGKRLELLKEAVPGISRVAHLGNSFLPGPKHSGSSACLETNARAGTHCHSRRAPDGLRDHRAGTSRCAVRCRHCYFLLGVPG